MVVNVVTLERLKTNKGDLFFDCNTNQIFASRDVDWFDDWQTNNSYNSYIGFEIQDIEPESGDSKDDGSDVEEKNDDDYDVYEHRIWEESDHVSADEGLSNQVSADDMNDESIDDIYHDPEEIDEVAPKNINGDIAEMEGIVYLEQPEGAKVPGKEDWVYRLNKALYGIAGKLWNKDMDKFLKSIGFTNCNADACVYKGIFNGESMYNLVHVDDFSLGCKTKDTMAKVKSTWMKNLASKT